MTSVEVLIGDSRDLLKTLPEQSFHCCVTSPPYWGLRDYKTATWEGGSASCDHIEKTKQTFNNLAAAATASDGRPRSKDTKYAGTVHIPFLGVCGKCGAKRVDRQIGIEPSPDLYVESMVEIFRLVRRTLRDDGTLWLNLGDSYAGAGNSLGNKNLVGIPWRVAFALQADGWFLRQWMPWVKRNCIPESVTDRPSSACETIFLLSKSQDYYYDHEAVKLPASMAFVNDPRWSTGSTPANIKSGYSDSKAQNPKSPHRMFDKQRGHAKPHHGFRDHWDNLTTAEQCSGWRSTRNSDWFFEGLLSSSQGTPLAFIVPPANFKDAHFATFPPNLAKPCILAGSPTNGHVLDPFAGSGTTGMVALELSRNATLIELNPKYKDIISKRTFTTPGLPL